MARPFTFTPAEGVDPANVVHPLKPGWHKRALAADKAASRRPYTAARPRSLEADAKARQYARWLAERDGLDLTGLVVGAVAWLACAAGWRPRAVTFTPNGKACAGVSVLLPHWGYVAPPVVEVHAAPWTAPIVVEVTGADRAALLNAMAEAEAGAWVEAVSGRYAEPAAWAIDGTDPEPEPCADPEGGHDPLPPAPVEAIPAPAPVEAIAAAESWGPTRRTHPVVALCLSPESRRRLLSEVLDGTAPAEGRTARGGAWMVSVEDAMSLQAIPSVRWVGLPRRRYTARHMPTLAPVEAIAPTPPVEAIPHPAFLPGGGRVPSAVTFHAAP